ncbi:MAG TPA: DUF4397 domain-containing protein, partial [Rubricoccaceae bacterium]
MRLRPVYRLALIALASLAATLPARAQLRPDWTAPTGGDNASNSGWTRVVPGPDGSVTVAGSGTRPYVERYAAGGARLWQVVGSDSEINSGVGGLAVGPDGAAFLVTQLNWDLAVRRVNADGTPGWNIVRDGPNSGDSNREYDTIFDAAITPDGDVVAVAQTGFGAGSQTWTIRLDGATGAVEWERVYDGDTAGAGIERPQRIGVDCAGHVYSAGFGYLQGYVVEYMPDGTEVRAGRIGFQVPGGGPAATVLDEMHVACDGTVTVSGVSEVNGASRPRAYVAQFAPGSGSTPTWATFPYLEEAYVSGIRITELAVDALGRASMQVSLWDASHFAHGTAIAQLDASGAVRWTARPASSPSGSSSHYALAVDAATVYTSGGFGQDQPNTYRNVHQAFSAENGAPLGIVDFVLDPNVSAVVAYDRGAAVDAAGGYVVGEGWQVRRLTTLPASVAEVQIKHAAGALAGLGPVQVYLNQPATSTTPDATVTFTGGSVFVNVPSGQPLEVRARLVNPPPFGIPQEVSFTQPALAEGRHVVSLAGIPAQLLASYAQNPSGIVRDLTLIIGYLGLGAAEEASPARGGNVAVVVTNAVTDAPAVDVIVAGTGQILADDLPYRQAAAPVTMTPGTYRVEVRRAGDGSLIEAVRFTLDGTEGIFALATTGFLNPAANQNGPAFALTATDSTGTVDGGVIVTGAEDAPTAGLSLAVASPTRAGAAVRYAVPTDGPVRLVVVDVLGREVAVLADGERAAGAHTARLNGAHAPGADVVRLTTPGGASSR